MLVIIGVLAGVVGLLADVISGNRKILQEIQYELRKMDYGPGHEAMKNSGNSENCKVVNE